MRRARGWFFSILSRFRPPRRRVTATSVVGRDQRRRDGAATPRRRDAVDATKASGPTLRAQVNLGALNERWAKIEFLCDFYKGTDVPSSNSGRRTTKL